MGSKRVRDSAMEQFVFFCAKDSVAAVKIESSNLGADEAEVVVFESWEKVFSAGGVEDGVG